MRSILLYFAILAAMMAFAIIGFACGDPRHVLGTAAALTGSYMIGYVRGRTRNY